MKKALLIPGLGGTADCWAPFFTGRLETKFSIESKALPEEGETIKDFAELLMPSESIDLLIGFSIGAAVVQEMLVLNPNVASKVVLMAPPAGSNYPSPPNESRDFSKGRGKWSLSMLEMMFTPEWLATVPDVSQIFPRIKKQVPEELLIKQSKAISDWPGCLSELKTITVPVLILSGLYDMITPVVHSNAIQNSIPNATFYSFETGHAFPWQNPIEAADKILEFYQ